MTIFHIWKGGKTLSNIQCKYCQFREICDKADGGEVKWEEFKKKIERLEGETSGTV